MTYSAIWQRQSQAKNVSKRITNAYFQTHWFLTEYVLGLKSGYMEVTGCYKGKEQKACEVIVLNHGRVDIIMWQSWLPFTIHHTCEVCQRAWDEKMATGKWTSK